MTAEPPKKRAWFQLHLSTCVALMVVAGALVWANVSVRGPYLFEASHDSQGYIHAYDWGMFRGWPMDYSKVESHHVEPGLDSLVMKEDREFVTLRLPKDSNGAPYFPNPYEMPWASYDRNIVPYAIAIDTFTALAILIFAAVVCEYLVSRRARRKQSD